MSVEPQHLVFTPDDWFHPQEIRVNGVQDGQHDGNSVVTVITSHTSSSDPRYAGFPVEDRHYNVQDSTHTVKAASYTHLTLPTTCPVSIPVLSVHSIYCRPHYHNKT